MQKPVSEAVEFRSEQESPSFNFNKLQAVICIAASALVSIGVIVWLVKAFS